MCLALFRGAGMRLATMQCPPDIPVGFLQEFIMNNVKTHPRPSTYSLLLPMAFVVMAGGLSACADMSARDRNTATGAVIGGAAGAVITGGSAAGTVGGAAVGGVIGNQVDPHKK